MNSFGDLLALLATAHLIAPGAALPTSEARAGFVRLMKRNAVHILATDAHGLDSRPPILSKARQAAEKIVGKASAHAMVSENPQAVVSGQALSG